MATEQALQVFLRSIDAKSYYQVLGVSADASPAAIKVAFHEFSLLYHPDRYVEAPSGVGLVATAIYKRGVEAYRCVSRQGPRARYDAGLARGALRPEALLAQGATRPTAIRTLETLVKTVHARPFAVRADRLIAVGRLSEARVQLVSACQCEPDNEELSERLHILYEALALEPS